MSASEDAKLDIQSLKGIGPSKAKLLANLDIHTLWHAVYHFPFRYEDRSAIARIIDLQPQQQVTVTGTILEASVIDLARGGMKITNPRFMRGRRKLLEVTINDGTGPMRAKFFNQAFLYPRFKIGTTVVLSGTVKHSRYGNIFEMDSPVYEFAGSKQDTELVHTGRVVPVYSSTDGLGGRQLREIVLAALDASLKDIKDPMPPEMLKRLALPELQGSIREIHFPSEQADVDALNKWESPAQIRVVFDELFMLEAGLALLKSRKSSEPGTSFKSENILAGKLLKSLPFSLTKAQHRAIEHIYKDMESPTPMNRLMQGDVGSGKTVVALLAMLRAVECGAQAALMAPTEILAEQHYITLHGLLEPMGISIALLTGSTKDRPYEAIAQGEINIVIGTHALIQESVSFHKLGLAVIDEQHRFGVKQRAELRKKARNPDVLIMTATPIPRTLSLTLYGDLDYTVIDELPPGRTPVETRHYNPDSKQTIYSAIEQEIKDGGQVYVVYPLVEEADSGLKNAVQGAEAMVAVFPLMRVGLIHGRMAPAEKENIMLGFKAGDIDILVCTTVIEVGVDVPNASLMLIVHAERFGLSQLHQLRGRVGRGHRVSRCMLLAYSPRSQEATRRLQIMCATNDGFKIAEEDLAIRGPGEVMGTRQSGIPGLRTADLLRDVRVLEMARNEAFSLIKADPELKKHPLLKDAVQKFWQGRIELFHTG